MIHMNISAAISWYERELKYLEAAPGINGCPMTPEWEEQINVHTTALTALRELEQVKRERDAAVSCIYEIEDDLDRGNDNDWAREHIEEWRNTQKEE